MANKEGKKFEEDVETSCSDQQIFYHRVKDVYIPPDLRNRIRVPKNKYDAFFFSKGYLFPIEFKSTKLRTINVKDPKIIKPHQTENLKKSTQYKNTIPGFIFNFRDHGNKTYFIHIDDFITYKNVLEGIDTETTYDCKINKSSISLEVCSEIGVEIVNVKKKVRYRYYINKLIDELIGEYQ